MLPRRFFEIVLIASLGWLVTAASPNESMAQSPYEPNDGTTVAAGPLLSGQSYAAALEVVNDRDFFFFYVAAASDTNVALTVENFGGGSGTSQIDAKLVDSTGTSVGGALYLIKGERRTATATLAPGKYYVEIAANEVNQGQEASYRLTPEGDSGAFAPYGSIAARCANATSSVASLRAGLKRARTKLLRAIGRVRRARYGNREARDAARALYARAKRRVAAKKRALTAAEQAQQPWCFIPQ